MMELKNLTLEELVNLSDRIKEEIQRRKVTEEKLVVYTHDCKDEAKYHKNKYKHWAKAVKAVNTSYTNGYAFIGDFLNIDYEHKLPVGTIVVEVCGNVIIGYEITENGKEEFDNGSTKSMSRFIDIVAEKLKEKQG